MPVLAKPLPDYEVLHKLFKYYPKTGELVYKPRTAELFPRKVQRTLFNRKYASCVAGHYDCSKEYIVVYPFGSKGGAFFVHRVAYAMYHGECPVDMQVDHVNGIKDDNRIENLRLVTAGENSKNRKKQKGGTSRHVGVHYNKHVGKWRASINFNGKRVSIGEYESEEVARRAREVAEKKYGGYHKNHGRIDPSEYVF